MFKFKYNFLVLMQISVNLLNSILLLKLLGVSYKADVYLMSIAIFSSISLIQLMFVEQFMFFYNDAKTKNQKFAYDFYNFSIFLAFFVGLFLFFVLYLIKDSIINLYAFNLDLERKKLLIKCFSILLFGGVFNLIMFVNIKLLNSEMKFSIPYILETLPGVFTLLSLIYIMILNNLNIELIIWGRVIGIIISVIISFVVIKKMNFPIKFIYKHKLALNFIRNSFTMRLGHNIHNFLFTPITSNILSSLPSGYASSFYYSQKLIQIVYSFTTGPSYRIYISKVSYFFSKKNIREIQKLIIQYIKITLPLFLGLSILVYFIIPYIIPLLSSKLSQRNIYIIQNIYLFLLVWYTVLSVEASVTPIGISSKNSKIFIITNSIFILTYFLISYFLRNIIGVYSIPIAAFIAQIINFISYSLYAKKIIKDYNVTKS